MISIFRQNTSKTIAGLKTKRQRFKCLQYRPFHITFLKEKVDSPKHEVAKFAISTSIGL